MPATLPDGALPSGASGSRGRADSAASPTAAGADPPKRLKKGKEADVDADAEMVAGGSRGRGRAGAKAPARAARGAKKAGKDTELNTLMLKSLLSCMQNVRTLNGAMFDCVLLEAEAAPAVRMMEQGRRYAELVKADRTQVEGPPHVYVWAGLIEGLISCGEKIGAKTLGDLKAFYEKYNDYTLDEKCEEIQVAKCGRAYHSETKRLVLCVTDKELRRTVLHGLQQIGGEVRRGRAPRGAMERELEGWLQGMK